jgi:hypothetical protein
LGKRVEGGQMGLWSRLRGRSRPGTRRSSTADDEAHLRAWAAAHEGVEAFVEPRTAVTDTTVVLVAKDGEWTRRRIGSPAAAKKFARSLRMPIYDAEIVGYPKRMRDHDARQRVLRDRARRRDLGA